MIRLFADPAEFVEVTAPLLNADPARATVLITVAHGLMRAPNPGAAPMLLAVMLDGKPAAAAVHMQPYPVSLVIDPALEQREAVARELGQAVADHGCEVTWFAGPRDDCSAVAAAWALATGASVRPHMDMLLHRLGEFRPATGSTGTSRPADPGDLGDLDLLAQWRHDFSVAVGDPMPPEVEHSGVQRSFKAGATMMLWCDEQGRPVSLASHSPVVAGMARIGPVYTPVGHERRGHGTAVTSAAVTSAQAQGADTVLLFTDVANPTSNAIYRRLGFEPVEEFLELLVVNPS